MELQNIKSIKNKLDFHDPTVFSNAENSFTHFISRLYIKEFRHIKELEILFEHPVTVISGTNKIGKTSILLLLACSHYNFLRVDSTKPTSTLRRHTWKDVLQFTSYENTTKDYEYHLDWRVGNDPRNGNSRRLHTSRSWSGVGKASKDPKRKNAQIKEREVPFIDLERILPARNISNSLLRKISHSAQTRVNCDIEKAFCYIFSISDGIEIYDIGSHVNKKAFLLKTTGDHYSSFNAASGEESVLNILEEIIESPKNSFIIIDEIEAGFHPFIQRKIADVINYVSWRDKKQFVITTHSPTLISAFNSKSRKFIEPQNDGNTKCINRISVNAAFSKMDSKAYPLLHLYCEDNIANFILKNLLIKLNQTYKYFDRLVNVIESGPANMVKNDYERHKRNFEQMRLKIGYACVFDGDYKNDPYYSQFHKNPNEHSMFLFPYMAPEKFLINAYLKANPNQRIQTSLNISDHHTLFLAMVNEGLAADESQALNICWQTFITTPEFQVLENTFNEFILKATSDFTVRNE
ncbi:AAA family ATPase [Mariniflexile sp. HNIBRBA6329]|uniref:AAA family ATPase n=1 Tax=Mariniflexile sp. HNIBRBA6329 TaxID=3373088 RepID=UPI003744D251